MEVKPGYKQTEVGVIPEEWSIYRLRDVAHIQRGASPRPIDAAVWYDSTSTVGWVRISDVTASDGKHLRSTADYFSKRGIANSRYMPSGSLIMSICATVGMPVITFMDACIHDGFVGFTKLRQADQDFLYYKLKQLEPAFKAMGQTGSQANLNSDLVRDCYIALPPHLEQRAIAEALSDADALIESLEQLLAKKRDLKQAAMQQLLTGQKRLPGFSGEWEILIMAEKSTLKARIGWQGLTTAEYLPTGEYYLVTGTDFVGGRVNWATCCFVDASRYVQDKNIQLKPRDILLTKDGTIGKVGFVDALPGPATLNSGVFVIRPKGDAYDPLFFYYILTSRVFEDFLAQLQAGSTISHLYQKDFVNFRFRAPSVPEQTAIADVLSDMDAEIAALEQRLAKTRALKQGMMQELLTGRIRLV